MRKKPDSGFTLVELLIVIAVIGILIAIAIPNYNDYITRSRITAAVATLSDMRVKLEQYFADNRTYVGACVAGTVAPLPNAADNSYFDFTCPGASLQATSYDVVATGKSSMAGFIYHIKQSGKSTETLGAGWSGAPNATCWVISKGGGC